MEKRARFRKTMCIHDRYFYYYGEGRDRTVASYYNEETDELQFGQAVCSPEDQFTKKIGRKLAGLRAINKPFMKMKVTEDIRLGSILYNVASMLRNAKRNRINI